MNKSTETMLLLSAGEMVKSQEATIKSLAAALEDMTRTFLDGSHYVTNNPYLRPEVKAALIALGNVKGKSTFGNDWMDAIETYTRTRSV